MSEGCLGDKAKRARLRWSEHVQRRDRIFMEGEDTELVGVREEDAEDSVS